MMNAGNYRSLGTSRIDWKNNKSILKKMRVRPKMFFWRLAPGYRLMEIRFAGYVLFCNNMGDASF